jgi:hypothetical protein
MTILGLHETCFQVVMNSVTPPGDFHHSELRLLNLHEQHQFVYKSSFILTAIPANFNHPSYYIKDIRK